MILVRCIRQLLWCWCCGSRPPPALLPLIFTMVLQIQFILHCGAFKGGKEMVLSEKSNRHWQEHFCVLQGQHKHIYWILLLLQLFYQQTYRYTCTILQRILKACKFVILPCNMQSYLCGLSLQDIELNCCYDVVVNSFLAVWQVEKTFGLNAKTRCKQTNVQNSNVQVLQAGQKWLEAKRNVSMAHLKDFLQLIIHLKTKGISFKTAVSNMVIQLHIL